MGLDDLLSKLESRVSDTSNTPCNSAGVSMKLASNKACTPDTSDTSHNLCVEDWTGFDHFLSAPIVDDGDLRTCRQCQNLRGRICRIAQPGGLVSANRGYRPRPNVPMRCAGYLPHSDDPDPRPGTMRWPGLSLH